MKGRNKEIGGVGTTSFGKQIKRRGGEEGLEAVQSLKEAEKATVRCWSPAGIWKKSSGYAAKEKECLGRKCGDAWSGPETTN